MSAADASEPEASRRPRIDARAVREALERSDPRLVSPRPGDRQAAVTLVLRPRGAGIDTLFVKRAEVEGDPWSGHMALPGGHVDGADRDLIETARRETREEVAIDLDREAFLGRLDDLYPLSRDLPAIVISPFVAWEDSGTAVIPNHEVQYHRWVSLAALRAPRHRSELRLERRGEERVFPSIMVRGDSIWGLTHQIVMNFLQIIDRARTEPREPTR